MMHEIFNFLGRGPPIEVPSPNPSPPPIPKFWIPLAGDKLAQQLCHGLDCDICFRKTSYRQPCKVHNATDERPPKKFMQKVDIGELSSCES